MPHNNNIKISIQDFIYFSLQQCTSPYITPMTNATHSTQRWRFCRQTSSKSCEIFKKCAADIIVGWKRCFLCFLLAQDFISGVWLLWVAHLRLVPMEVRQKLHNNIRSIGRLLVCHQYNYVYLLYLGYMPILIAVKSSFFNFEILWLIRLSSTFALLKTLL